MLRREKYKGGNQERNQSSLKYIEYYLRKSHIDRKENRKTAKYKRTTRKTIIRENEIILMIYIFIYIFFTTSIYEEIEIEEGERNFKRYLWNYHGINHGR